MNIDVADFEPWNKSNSQRIGFIAGDLIQLGVSRQEQEAFVNTFGSERLADVVSDLLEYANKLSLYPGDLIYEEMLKLFSLLDSIWSIELICPCIDTNEILK